MEALFEILFEIFGELILHIIGYVVGGFFDYLNANSKVKKIVKSCVGFTFFGLILLVLILSLIYQKTALLIVTIVYFIIVTILNLLKFTNKNNFNNKGLNKTINVIKHILHYSFPIVLIAFGAISLEKVSSRAWLISLSIVAMVIRFAIDLYKLDRYQRKSVKLKENINPQTFNITSDKKTIEYIANNKTAALVCLNSIEKEKIKVGDKLNITNRYVSNKAFVIVKDIKQYKDIKKIYNQNRYDIPYKTFNELKDSIEDYYTKEDIERIGLLLIKVEKLEKENIDNML